MFMNPYLSRELAHERQREMLTHAQHQRLAQRLHAQPGTAQHRQQPSRRLRRVLRAAARTSTAPQT